MIRESYFWKNDLLNDAKKLRKMIIQKRWPERSFVNFEKLIFRSFYSIRKLMDADKISSSFRTKNIQMVYHLSKGKPVTRLNWHRFNELFDLDCPHDGSITLPKLCHQIVHSYVFQPVFNEGGFIAFFYVTSDRERQKRLLRISLNEVINLLEAIGKNYPSKSSMIFNKKRRDYDVEIS